MVFWYQAAVVAGGRNRPIEGCQQDILAHGRSFVALRGVTVDRADDVQLLSRVPERGGCSEISLFGEQSAPRSLGQAFEQLLSGTEMAHNANTRPSALVPIGFDDAPVSFSSDRVALEARHNSYIHDLVRVVNRNRNLLLNGPSWGINAEGTGNLGLTQAAARKVG
jgi:hypothetical protein